MKLDLERGVVDMTHGSGGRAMAALIDQIFAPAFSNAALAEGNDQARLDLPLIDGLNARLAISTDSFVVSPVFFPGGDIGDLAINGTVNDVALSGARPLWLSAGFILEEGFALSDLVRIVRSMARAAEKAGVQIVTGDTKVVEKGKADGVYINTCGVGALDPRVDLSVSKIQPGDAILLSGPLGDHGVAVMSARTGLSFETPVLSDTASLNGLIARMIETGAALHALRDPTRGGLGATLNEMAAAAGCGILLNEAEIPIRPAVRGVCEILGLDPLYVANEGRLIAFCAKKDAEKLCAAMRSLPEGAESVLIGHVAEKGPPYVEMKTALGGFRMVDWLAGEQLPRIC